MSACSSCKYCDDMIQLIECLISGYLLTWLRVEGFDNGCCGYLSTDVHVQGGTFHSYFSLADMTQTRNVFTLLLFSLLLLSHSLPSSAVKSQFYKVPTKPQLPQGRQNGLVSSFQTPKLGVHIRKRARYYPRSGRKSSAVRTQLPSGHIIGSVLAFLSFFLF